MIDNHKFTELVDVAHLTAPLAIQAAQVDDTNDSRVQLNILVHLFENLLRLAAGLSIGDLRAEESVAPDRLAQALLMGMNNPTYETWRLIADQAASGIATKALVPSMRGDLEMLSSLANEIRKRRNDAAHALPGDAWIETTLASLKPRIASALKSLPWLYKLELHARLPDQTRVPLHGETVDLGKTNLDEVIVEGLVEGRFVDLFPFVILVPGQSKTSLAVCRSLGQGWDAVEFYGLGRAGALGKTKAKKQLQRFAAWCRYDERRRLLGDSGPLGDTTTVPKLYGRASELQAIAESVQQQRVTWVEGIAGIGKSLLVEHVARDNRLRAKVRVLPWRFRITEPRPVLTLYKHLVEKLGPEGHLVPRGLADDPAVWLRYLKSLVSEFGGPQKETVVILEGLDEAGDEAFSNLPFEVTAPSVRWLCSGRPTERLRATYAEDRCHRIQVRELTPSAIRAWLVAEAPALEPFADDIQAASQGLPVYLRTVIIDLAAGRYRPGDPLPPASRLREFWLDAIKRATSQNPAVARLCLDVLEIVAHSIAPLTPPVLRGILSSAGILADGAEPDSDLEQAIEATSSLILREEAMDHELVLRLTHATLTDALRTDHQFRNARHSATRALVDFVRTTDVEPMLSHTSRFGIRQLFALERDDEAFRLLGDFRWICARLFSRSSVDARRRRHAEVQADLDALPLSHGHPELEELRNFLANHLVPIAEFGFGFLYQACANGDAGSYWMERGAIRWAATEGAAFRTLWMERVSMHSEHTIPRPLLELVVPELPPIASEDTDREERTSSDVRSLAFEPNGRYLLTTHWTGRTLRWDLRTGSWAPVAGVDGVLLGFQGDDAFWLQKDRTVERWKQSSGEKGQYELIDVRQLPGRFRAAWRTEAKRYVASCQDGPVLQLIRLDDGEVLGDGRLRSENVEVETEAGLGIIVGPNRFLVGNAREVFGPTLPIDFGMLQTAVSADRVVPFTNTCTFAVSEPHGAIYRIGFAHQEVDEFDLATIERRASIPIANAQMLHAGSAAGPAENTIAFALSTGGLVICDIERRVATATAPVHLSWFRVAIASGGERLATTDGDTIRLWSVEALLKTTPHTYKVRDETEAVTMMSLPVDGDRVACVHYHGELRILEFSTGKVVQKDRGFASPEHSSANDIRSAKDFSALSGDGRRIVGLASWYGLKILDIPTGHERTIWFSEGDDEYNATGLSSLSLPLCQRA